MEKFWRFAAGVAITVAYGVLALIVATAVSSVAPDLWAICLLAVLLGWAAIIVVAFRKEQPWIGYGVIAAPFIAVLLVTISCFVAVSVNGAVPV